MNYCTVIIAIASVLQPGSSNAGSQEDGAYPLCRNAASGARLYRAADLAPVSNPACPCGARGRWMLQTGEKSSCWADMRLDAPQGCHCGETSPSARRQDASGGGGRKINYQGQELQVYVVPGEPTEIKFPGEIRGGYKPKKPVIYLYPTAIQDVTVRLGFDGALTASYPPYDPAVGGWQVTAHPDGQLINKADNREYNYIFWEGRFDSPLHYDPARGFVVRGQDTREFLVRTLRQFGLTPKEYNDFVVFWCPRMKDHAYNHIFFAGPEFDRLAPLNITPRPDSVLRVFMVYRALDREMHLEPQAIVPFQRKGFTVVEWGGCELEGDDARSAE